VRRQPRDNPGYVRNERKYLRSDETKTLDFSALCGAITGFGTQVPQVWISLCNELQIETRSECRYRWLRVGLMRVDRYASLSCAKAA
jgi:hypothetical protein